jgi:hypothetical protein
VRGHLIHADMHTCIHALYICIYIYIYIHIYIHTQALAHPYMAELHDPEDEPECEGVFDFDYERREHNPATKVCVFFICVRIILACMCAYKMYVCM